ncbi:AraC family transcriptional regulator [Bacterioplanes sanyensis]|uniref:AraC family transcriptional regulator n=1 Tax=Bacterioplanes sanyensis TaxID=1249553 RepID=A0A222FL68_9GAMM|nr:helix-turn-helix domain-containing protein [Bacterioplanes sanyensis]ASP39509.1 AraC family transcriptional regulator [Bacterioplanes sanyensis]
MPEVLQPLRHVSLLALPKMLSSSIAIPMEMLEAARARLLLQRAGDSDFTIELVARQREPMTMLGGFPLQPHKACSEVEHTDLIVVPALWRNPRPVVKHEDSVVRWLRQRYLQGASIVAVGTGVCMVAAAGLLDGQVATTHWHYLDAFARDYPRVKLQRERLLTQAGRIYCAASVNSGADMMVHLLAMLYGKPLALAIEQQFSPEVRNPLDKGVFHDDQYSRHADEAIAHAQSWLRQNMLKPLQLELLAAQVGLSERQLERRFKQVTELTPGQYLQRLRCDQACELLQHSNLSVADIASATGFSDSSHLGRVFRRWLQQTPGQYRQKVRLKLFSG